MPGRNTIRRIWTSCLITSVAPVALEAAPHVVPEAGAAGGSLTGVKLLEAES